MALPPTEQGEDGDVIYPQGLSEGNLLAMCFAAQELSNPELLARWGAPIGQALIDRGYGKDQLPAVDRQTAEGKKALVDHALRLGLVRDRYGRPHA